MPQGALRPSECIARAQSSDAQGQSTRDDAEWVGAWSSNPDHFNKLRTQHHMASCRAVSAFAENTTHTGCCRIMTPSQRLRARAWRRRFENGPSSSQGSLCARITVDCSSACCQDSLWMGQRGVGGDRSLSGKRSLTRSSRYSDSPAALDISAWEAKEITAESTTF